MGYGHGSWVAVVVFVALFAVRALSSQRRGARRRGPGPGSPWTDPRHHPRAPGPPTPGLPDDPGPSAVVAPGRPATTSGGTPPGWFTDPFVRHAQRYWSGSAWTEHVVDDGVPGVDPPPTTAPGRPA